MSRAVARPFPTRSVDPTPTQATHTLPPFGASPATDLQHRLAQAALHDFYTLGPTRPWRLKRRVAVAIGTALLGWGVVFGTWALIAAR